MPAKIASRYTRPLPIPIRLTSRDESIITRCFEDKLCSTSDVSKIFNLSIKNCSRRLRMLFSNHYLDRYFFPTSLPYLGSSEAYYALGKNGIEIAAMKIGLERRYIQRARQKLKKQLKSYSILLTLAHINSIAKVRISFERAFEKDKNAELRQWIPERLLEQRFNACHERSRMDDNKRLKLRPDGFMQYQIKDSGKIYSAFIEVDLSTQSKKQIKDKIKRYLAFSETDLPQKEFSTRWFRVIFISKGKCRSQEIKEAIEAVTNKIFWITDLSEMEGDDWLNKPIFLKVGLPGRFSLITQNWDQKVEKKGEKLWLI